MNQSYVWSTSGEQMCLTHYIHFNTIVQFHLQLVISNESKLDASSLKGKKKTEVGVLQLCKTTQGGVEVSIVIIRLALKWLIVRSW